MASIRLTNSIRETIVSGMLDRKFALDIVEIQEIEEQLRRAKEELEGVAYSAAFSPEERQRLNSAPAGYFPERDGVYGADEDGQVFFIRFDEKRRIPYENYQRGLPVRIFSDSDPYRKLVFNYEETKTRHDNLQGDLELKRRDLRTKAMGVLNSVTTVAKLVEVWPEVSDFLPEENSGPEGGVPAVLISDLNQAFGL